MGRSISADAAHDKGFLPNTWRDTLAIAGLVLGLVGFLLTLVGLWYAIRQVRQATSAAAAAKNAAEATPAQDARPLPPVHRGRLARHGGSTYLEAAQWGKAAIRLDDLADDISRLEDDPEWAPLADGLRDASNECKALE